MFWKTEEMLIILNFVLLTWYVFKGYVYLDCLTYSQIILLGTGRSGTYKSREGLCVPVKKIYWHGRCK